MKRLRIAYLITRGDTLGGAQVHVRDIATRLQQEGHAVHVFAGGDGPLGDDLRARGVPFTPLRHLQRAIGRLTELRAAREIARELRAFQPDLLTTHSSKAGLHGRVVGRLLGIPVVHTAHGWAFNDGVEGRRRQVFDVVERVLGRLATHIITVSEFDRGLALERRIAPPSRITAVRNGMPDLDPPRPANPSVAPPHLIMVARFNVQKDQRTLVEALGGLQDLEWTGEIVGDGELYDEVKARVAELGLDDRLALPGFCTDVQDRLARAQIYALITRWEGLPLTVIEGMRAGLPVVSNAVSGVPEAVLDGQTGLLARRGDVAAVREALRKLITDADLRATMGAAGRARYEAEFTFDHMYEGTVAVYRRVLEGR